MLPLFPLPPNLPIRPNRNIRVTRRAMEAIRDAMTVLKNFGAPVEVQKEWKELLEAVRRAGYAEGYAAAKMEIALGSVGANETSPAPAETEGSAREDKERAVAPHKDNAEEAEYVSRVPFKTTRNMALDYLRAVDRAAGPTEIIKNTIRTTGVRLTMTTLRRALDELVTSGEIKEVDNSRWRAVGARQDAPRPALKGGS